MSGYAAAVAAHDAARLARRAAVDAAARGELSPEGLAEARAAWREACAEFERAYNAALASGELSAAELGGVPLEFAARGAR